MSEKKICRNLNHGKSNAAVLFCPTCGEKFNSIVSAKKYCLDEKHRERRKAGSKFCVDCGGKL